MQNLVILYNPYYNQEVIEDHIRILHQQTDLTNAKVGFGKVRSQRRDYEHPFEEKINEICDSVDSSKPMQLFLTDFSSAYVCYVQSVTKEQGDVVSPAYYDDLEVDRWFIVTDIREIARNDFAFVRDRILSNFTTPNYGDHTYALYGNRYDYPLMIDQKEPIHYFEDFADGDRHFTRVFKSKQYASIQHDLMHYVFGHELLYELHPDSLESLIGAEVDYLEHKDDATFDFSAIVIAYGKVFENEVYYFLRKLFSLLMTHNPALAKIEYSVQGRDYILADYVTKKPNIGTNKFLLANSDVFYAFTEHFDDKRQYASLLNLLKFDIKNAASAIQEVRNKASHEGMISREKCMQVREQIIGIGTHSIISALLKHTPLVK